MWQKTSWILLAWFFPALLLAQTSQDWKENAFMLEGATNYLGYSGSVLISHDLSDEFFLTLELEQGYLGVNVPPYGSSWYYTNTSNVAFNAQIDLNNFIDLDVSTRLNRSVGLYFMDSAGLGLDYYDFTFKIHYTDPNYYGSNVFYGQKEYSGLAPVLKLVLLGFNSDASGSIRGELGFKCRVIFLSGTQTITTTDGQGNTEQPSYGSGLWVIPYPELFLGVGYGF